MKKKYVLVIAILVVLAIVVVLVIRYIGNASSSEPISVTTDSVVFKKGCYAADSSCLYISFHFPVVDKDKDGRLSMLLNSDFLQMVGDSLKGTMSGTIKEHLSSIAMQYDSSFVDYTGAFPSGAVNTWYLKVRYNVLINDGKILCIQYLSDDYMGGAHGTYRYHYLNLALQQPRPLAISDIVSDLDVFAERAEEAFRQHFKIPEGKSLDNFWFPQGKFILPSEYGFSTEGVILHYNVYEIAPYSDGDIKVVVPYSSIKDILNGDWSYLADVKS
ncbi:MAG TPA: DUF3298 domain-containing protein [Williamwhitmania sp.]|nr:DUF3298 domain-containing protein [Williamwhitmania sp.]